MATKPTAVIIAWPMIITVALAIITMATHVLPIVQSCLPFAFEKGDSVFGVSHLLHDHLAPILGLVFF
jgi:hypothetical protein